MRKPSFGGSKKAQAAELAASKTLASRPKLGQSLFQTGARAALEVGERSNESPVIATLQQQAIPSPNDGALAKLFLDNFFSGFASAARGANACVLTLIAHRRPYAIDETVPSPKNGFQHRRRRPRP